MNRAPYGFSYQNEYLVTARWVLQSGYPTQSRSHHSYAHWDSPADSSGQTSYGCFVPPTHLGGTSAPLGHGQQLAALYIVDEAVDIDALWNKRRMSEEGHIVANRLFQVLEGQEVDGIGVGM